MLPHGEAVSVLQKVRKGNWENTTKDLFAEMKPLLFSLHISLRHLWIHPYHPTKSITYSNPVCLLLLVALLSPSFATQSCISTYPNGCHWHTSGGQIDYSFVFFLPKILALLLRTLSRKCYHSMIGSYIENHENPMSLSLLEWNQWLIGHLIKFFPIRPFNCNWKFNAKYP